MSIFDSADTGSAAPQEHAPDDGRRSAATVLVELAQSRYSFGVSHDGQPFAVPLSGAPVARLLRGGKRGLRSELAREYFQRHGKAAPQQALADALLVVEGLAECADPEPLPQRVAESGGVWWLDLGDASGNAVRIAPEGWQVTVPPLRFRRTILTGALPTPAPGGDLTELWGMLNVAEPDRPLVLAWLVAAMIAGIPHPILDLAGEQGTGKSTAAKILVALLDPSPVPLRKAPRDADSWVAAATGSWLVAVDNLSAIPEWLSDALCRAVTGDGDVRRQLYTDGGLALFAFRRVVVLTGIDLGAVRGDLADRLLVIDLDVIDERARRLDADLESRWQQARPRVSGALLTLAASVASALPYVRLERSPRMADFARVLAAVDEVLGTEGLARYTDRARNLAADSLTADPFVSAMAQQLTDAFTGTSAELLERVAPPDDKRAPKGWPANARHLTQILKRQAPVMRRARWEVTELPAGHDNALRWTVRRPEIACIEGSQYSRHSQGNTEQTRSASVASVEYGPSQDGGPDELHSCPHCGIPTVPSRAGHRSLCRACTAAELAALNTEREAAS